MDFLVDEHRGATDDFVLALAFDQGRVLVTVDKDFGERVYRDGRPHRGVILMRLGDERLAVKIETMESLLLGFAEKLPGRFVVVSEDRVRFAAQPAHPAH